MTRDYRMEDEARKLRHAATLGRHEAILAQAEMKPGIITYVSDPVSPPQLCCLVPAMCQRTAPCIHRAAFREAAKNIDAKPCRGMCRTAGDCRTSGVCNLTVQAQAAHADYFFWGIHA